jgi:hypothetical protein
VMICALCDFCFRTVVGMSSGVLAIASPGSAGGSICVPLL